MGVVHAKVAGQDSMMEDDDDVEKEIRLSELPAHVKRIHVDGLKRTKDDVVINKLQSVFTASNFEDMVRKSREAKHQLERLGLFSSIDITIDVGKDKNDGNDSYELVYKVKEPRRLVGGISTLVGTNEGSLLFGLKSPNMFGRGEKVNAELTYGTKNASSSSVVFSKPLRGNPDLVFLTTVFQNAGDYAWSGYRELDRGVATELNFLSPIGSHNLKWEGAWRNLGCLSNTTAFAIREQAGHSLKSSLKHTYTRDTRDSPVLPTGGYLFRASQECAGLGGDVEFLKHELELQLNKTLILDSVLQMSLAGGFMKPISSNGRLLINDRFLLGGPLTLRGFNIKGAGPHEDGCALGGNAYWCGGLHLYTPLPFRSGRGGFGDLFRTHFFVNAGNVSDINYNDGFKDNIESLRERFRWSYGLGVVLKMGGIARLEFNYCWPMAIQQGDSASPGLQFGIGVHFL